MIEREDVVENFSDMGIDLPEDVVDKCMELCRLYKIDGTDLFEIWTSFSATNREDNVPTVELLNMMEKKGLFKITSSKDNSSERKGQNSERKSLVILDDDMDLLNIEDTIPSSPTLILLSTAEQVKHKDSRPSISTPATVASFSEGNPTKEYTSRKNSGHVVCSYGSNVDTLSWTTSGKYAPEVDFSEEFKPVNPKVRYMFSTILDKIQSYKKQGDDLCKDIIDNNDLKTPLETHHITMETATFAGRILCDGRGKLNPSSLLLECCLFNIREDKVKLEVNEAPEYSLFPGQVIVVEGKNPDGKRIIAEKIYADAKPDIYPDFDPNKNLQESLQVVIACGPFMLTNGSYQPFLDLKKYVVENQPHVLIIIGPLVDAQNPNILQFGNNMKFIDCYESLLRTLVDDLEGTHTKVVYTSSWRESSLHIVYPTPPPLHVSFKSKNLSNLKFVPDPSILDISGFTIGVTASDILLHLSPEELCHPNTSQNVPRLCRIASHLLKQKSFYPLKPSHDEMSIDARLSTDHAFIPLKPHVLVLPSNLKSFVNVADDCVIINPERVAKGEYGGSFARLQVRKATDGEKWSPATHISAQVIKI